MSLELHERGIHALCFGTGGARVTNVCPGTVCRRTAAAGQAAAGQAAVRYDGADEVIEVPDEIPATCAEMRKSDSFPPDPYHHWTALVAPLSHTEQQ
jgi:hypothetical protein